MKLRPYQQEAVNGILESLERSDSTLAVMPTGTGKTVVFGHVAKHFGQRGRVMVIAHRDMLLDQAGRKVGAITGEMPDVEQAARYSLEHGLKQANYVVASVQTLNAPMGEGRRMERFDPSDFSLVIFDEAHHCAADTYRRVVKYFQCNRDIKILGVTATPDRSDEKALGQVFDSVAFEYEVSDAIRDGWLVPITQQLVDVVDLDLSGVSTRLGDFAPGELSRQLEDEKVLHEFASPTLEICGTKKTLVFASSVAHAERLAEIFNRYSEGMARVVLGKTASDEREDTIRSFRHGEFPYLINVGVATEGFDVPDIDCVVMARPTKSRALYSQMLGRGTRPLEGLVDAFATPDDRRNAIAQSKKPQLLVVDFVGNAGRHKLVHAADILGGNYDDRVVEMAHGIIYEEGKAGRNKDIDEALQEAEQEVARQEREQRQREEESRRAKLKIKAEYRVRKVNPFDVLDITPPREKGWSDKRRPTEKMIAFLEKMGVTDAAKLNFDEAMKVIGTIKSRMNYGWASYKQCQLLQRFGYETKGLRFKQASKLIDELARNGWRKPEKVA